MRPQSFAFLLYRNVTNDFRCRDYLARRIENRRDGYRNRNCAAILAPALSLETGNPLALSNPDNNRLLLGDPIRRDDQGYMLPDCLFRTPAEHLFCCSVPKRNLSDQVFADDRIAGRIDDRREIGGAAQTFLAIGDIFDDRPDITGVVAPMDDGAGQLDGDKVTILADIFLLVGSVTAEPFKRGELLTLADFVFTRRQCPVIELENFLSRIPGDPLERLVELEEFPLETRQDEAEGRHLEQAAELLLARSERRCRIIGGRHIKRNAEEILRCPG